MWCWNNSKKISGMENLYIIKRKRSWRLEYEKKITFVPKSVRAIAILFFAISKFGDTARHLTQQQPGHNFSRGRRYNQKLKTSLMQSSWIPLITCNCWLQVTTIFIDDTHVAVCFSIHRPLQSSLLIATKGCVILHQFRVDNTKVIICRLHYLRTKTWAKM